jgi:hypothetical protein
MISKQGITALTAAYCSYWSIICSINPEHFDASAPPWHEFKNSFAVDSGLLHLHPFTKKPFPLPHCCGICDLTRVAWVVQTVGWMMQRSPVKQPQQLLCWMCTVWGGIVVLKDNTSWSIICSGCLSNTWGVCQFHNDEKVEVAVPEKMQMREPNIYCSGSFKLVTGKVLLLHCAVRLKIKLINIIIDYNSVVSSCLIFNTMCFSLNGHH